MNFENILQFKNARYFVFLLCTAISISFSCTKDQPLLTNDIKILVERLKNENPDCICDPYLDEFKWNKKTVYVLASRGPACSWMASYYDLNGEEITALQSVNFGEFIQVSQRVRNAWTCGK